MSAIKDIKKEVVRKISQVPSINKVYDYEKLNPSGFPAAFITFSGTDSKFLTNAENERVYQYRVLVLAQIGQDTSNSDQVDVAEKAIEDITGEVLNIVDSDYTLGDFVEVIYVEAAVGEPGYVNYEGGVARSVEIQLKVHSIYLV